MKRIIYLIMVCLLLSGCLKKQPFYLDNEYYEKSEIITITNEELKQLELDKKNFLVFINMPHCTASNIFLETLNDFLNNNQLTIYEIFYSNIKDTSLASCVKYYPSVGIYKDGKVVGTLDPNKKEDIICYETEEGLKECLAKYIYFK